MQKKYTTKRCIQCGELFEAAKPNKRFCSMTCRIVYNNAKHKPIPLEPRKCAHCGQMFTPKHGGNKCCSAECQKARTILMAKTNRRADILAAHRGVTPPPRTGHFCPDPRCSWLKYEGYGKGFCVRPVCIYSQRTDKQ